MSSVHRTGLFSRNSALALVNRNRALSNNNNSSSNSNNTNSSSNATEIANANANENKLQENSSAPTVSPSKLSQLDSPASLNASFVKDQDGFDDVDAFFNQAVTPQKTPTAKSRPASTRATPSRTPLKANGLVAKPVAIISSKIAAHYRKEPRFAVSMSEVVSASVEHAEVEAEEDVEEESTAEVVESAMETGPVLPEGTTDSSTFAQSAPFAASDMQHFQYDHDNDYAESMPQDDDALVNQLVEEMLVDTDAVAVTNASGSANYEQHHATTATTATASIETEPITTAPQVVALSVRKAAKPKQPARQRQRRLPAYYPGAEYDENGLRRSKRQRMSPLRYWANEKVCYGRAEDPSITLPVIVNVIKKPELDDPTFMAGRSARTRRANPNSLRLKAQAFGPNVEAEGYVRVIDEDGREDEEQRLLALSHHHVEGDPVKGNNFRIHTMFTEGTYMSAGQLLFPHGSGKPAKNSARHALVFYVISGSFEVVVHDTKFLIGPGGQFHVPRNNAYSIAHVSTDKSIEGRLFFCHCKDNRE